MKRAILIFLLIGASLTFLLSCTAGKRPSGHPDTDPQQSGAEQNGSDSALLKYLEDNSALPCLPGTYLSGVDTDGFELTEDGALIVYSSTAFGMTYCFERGESADSSRLTEMCFTSVRYAILGITVGDSPSDAKTVFEASGFKSSQSGNVFTFTKGSVSVIMETTDNKISSVTLRG